MSDAGIYRALPVSDGEDGDSDAAVRVDLTDPAAAAEEEVEENSEAEQDDEAYSTSPRRCTLRIAILCGVLAPLITLLAVAGLLALVSLLASIRSQCNSGGGWQGGRQWQCWRRTAISQWVPQTLFASPSPTSLSSSPLPVNFSWTPESSPPSLNAIRLARVFDRLERGLPIVVGGIGGSNLQGGRLNWTQTVLPVLTAWLNEHFPVNTTDTQALEADRLVSLQRDCGSQMSRGPTMMEHAPPRHVFFNAAVGGTTSGVTSFCYRRLIPQCEFLQGVYSDADSWSYHDPDLLLVDFAVNDIIDDDPFTASPPAKNIERLVRQVLGHTSHTALVMVYFAVLLSEGLHNGEHIHHAVAERYQLPEVSIRKFSLDWLYEPRYERDAFKKVPDLKVQRPVPLSLPLPLVEAMKTLNAGQRVNMDSLFWMNGWLRSLYTLVATAHSPAGLTRSSHFHSHCAVSRARISSQRAGTSHTSGAAITRAAHAPPLAALQPLHQLRRPGTAARRLVRVPAILARAQYGAVSRAASTAQSVIGSRRRTAVCMYCDVLSVQQVGGPAQPAAGGGVYEYRPQPGLAIHTARPD